MSLRGGSRWDGAKPQSGNNIGLVHALHNRGCPVCVIRGVDNLIDVLLDHSADSKHIHTHRET